MTFVSTTNQLIATSPVTKKSSIEHSWARISSAGHNILLDALKILSPMSHDFSSSEELVTFLQDLSEEGHKPIVLRSKDVYGYRSCTSQPLTEDMLKPPNRNIRPTAKRRGKRPLVKKREVHPSWNTSERSNPRIQGVPPTELLVDHRAIICSRLPSQSFHCFSSLTSLAFCLFACPCFSCPLLLFFLLHSPF